MSYEKNVYDVTGKVLSLKGDDGDGDVVVTINEKVLECFIPDWRADGWYENQEKYKREKLLLKLSLMNITISKTEKEEKYLILKRPVAGSVNRYELCGEVVDTILCKEMEEYVVLIIDCGVYLTTTVPKINSYDTGDYVFASGRLDAKKVGHQK